MKTTQTPRHQGLSRLPLFAILHLLSSILAFHAAAQLPTNHLAPSLAAVMTDTNGVLKAPTNFFTANSNRLNAALGPVATNRLPAALAALAQNNGVNLTNLNISSPNLVPAGAMYDDGTLRGFPFYLLTGLNTNANYLIITLGNGEANDQGGITDTNTGYGPSFIGVFTPTNGYVEFYAENPSTNVLTQLYLVGTNTFTAGTIAAETIAANDINGTLDPAITIPAAALSASGAYLNGSTLRAVANGGVEHWIISTNTTDGSTLAIGRAGTTGYADVGFYTYGASTNFAPPNSPKLWWALGVSASTSAFPYSQPFIESYLNQYPIYYVGAGAIFGGFFSTGQNEGDWIWFQDGTTNTPMFRINRANNVISNYSTAVFAKGFSSLATNTYSMTATGFTNTANKVVRVFGFAGTSAYFSNRTSRTAFNLPATMPFFTLQTNECVVGTSCVASNIVDL